MKEYTSIAVVSVMFVLVLDIIAKTFLTKQRAFWIFWAVMFLLILLVNGYLTWRPIVIYGEAFYSGIRLFTIPIEDFLFGFSLITLNLIIWEYFSKKKKT